MCYFKSILNFQGDAQIIAGDVIIGQHTADQQYKPVMNQNGQKSDFSLKEFIGQSLSYHEIIHKYYNDSRLFTDKTIQLNFKSTDPVPLSIDELLLKRREVSVWTKSE